MSRRSCLRAASCWWLWWARWVCSSSSCCAGGRHAADRSAREGRLRECPRTLLNVPVALEIIQNYYTCEFTTLSRDGIPQTWPVTPRLLTDGRLLVGTSIGLPQKAYNVRRNPKVSMLFSDSTGSGVAEPGAVLIQGDATAEDRLVTDLRSEPDLAALIETITARQPAGSMWSSWLGRRLNWSYYIRLLI